MEKLTHDSLPTMPQGNLLEVLKLGEPSRAFQIGTRKPGLRTFAFSCKQPCRKVVFSDMVPAGTAQSVSWLAVYPAKV